MYKASLNFRISRFHNQGVAWLLLTIFLLSFAPSVSLAHQPTATVKTLSGNVLVSGQAAAGGNVLQAGDTIRTQAGALAVLELSDGSEIHLSENTEITFAELTQTAAGARVSSLNLRAGRVRAFLSQEHQQEGSAFTVETPNARIDAAFSQPDIEVSYNVEKAETIGVAHTVKLMAKNLATNEEVLVPVGATVIITSEATKVLAGILASTESTSAGTTEAESANTELANTGSKGMGIGKKIALGAGIVAAVGGVAALTISGEDREEVIGTGQIGDFNWYLGAQGLSCDQVCSEHGGCDQVGVTYAGSKGSIDVCTAVLRALGAPSDADGITEVKRGGSPTGCSVVMTTGTVPLAPAWIVFYSGDCAASYPDDRLACACQN